MRKLNLKASLIIFVAACLLCLAGLTSCADPNGLHDQQAVMVTFEFTGFGDELNGTFAIPGDYNDWNNSGADVSLVKGEGTSIKIAITSANIVFSLVPEGAWTRPWYVKGVLEGNGMDGTANKYQNFYYDGLDLSAGELTLVIDGSTGTATPKLK